MNSIGQEARRNTKFCRGSKKAREKGDKHAVKRIARYYRIGIEKVIYDWRQRWNGDWRNLAPKSHRPHRHPEAQREEEVQLIIAVNRECGFLEPMLLWQELRERGYTRSLGGMKRFIRKRFVGQRHRKEQKKSQNATRAAHFPASACSWM